MSTNSPPAIVDFDRMAGSFDRFLGLVAPVGDAVLLPLDRLADGAHAKVVDIACGTGEPGLTLAIKYPNVQLIGVDAAPTMIDIARIKGARAPAPNASFEVMTAEELRFPDASVDVVISRFGLFMFGDRDRSVREVRRVLRPGGSFSVALWDGMENNTLVRSVVDAIRPHVAPELLAPFDQFPRAFPASKIEDAGFVEVVSRPFSWHYTFASEDVLGDFVFGTGMFERAFGQMDDATKSAVRTELFQTFAPHRQPDGSYRMPHTCLLYTGRIDG